MKLFVTRDGKKENRFFNCCLETVGYWMLVQNWFDLLILVCKIALVNEFSLLSLLL